jgi:DNA-binding NtrC family response regulator
MLSSYEPQNHIVRVAVGPRSDAIVDQREITIQSYQTTILFDRESLRRGLESAWLSPQIRFGVFAETELDDPDALSVVLGLQDELSVRAYDYDQRRPLWYSWQDVIVDTVNIRYFKDTAGFLRFKTTGGGRRIGNEMLHKFNADFLGISRGSVTKQNFDLEKLRHLCFEQFVSRLYMLKFSDPSGAEYRSIDHAQFQSRRYIDPKVERLLEIQADAKVAIESFHSDVDMSTKALAAKIRVRFLIKGLSGSLQLRFPKITYRTEPKSPEEHARMFYCLVDSTERRILDGNYYTHQPRKLDEIEVESVMYPEVVDTDPFKEALISEESRREFFANVDVTDKWPRWHPHLRAIDELLGSDVVRQHVARLFKSLVKAQPLRAIAFLGACRDDLQLRSVGDLVVRVVADELPTIPSDFRAKAEEELFTYAVVNDETSWDVEAQTNEIIGLGFRRHLDDFSLDLVAKLLGKMFRVLHSRLCSCQGDAGDLLDKLSWCVQQAKELSPNGSTTPTALRLIAAGRVPVTVSDAAKVLKNGVSNLPSLDDEVLKQFGVPLWPQLEACQERGKVRISNTGIGTAIGLIVRPAERIAGGEVESSTMDLLPQNTTDLAIEGDVSAVDVEFTKFGQRYSLRLSVTGEVQATDTAVGRSFIPKTNSVSAKRRKLQRARRKEIDPDGVVIGTSDAIYAVFEDIYHANTIDGGYAVLILGEPGVGKTHIAELLHKASSRSSKPFRVVNAGGSGGDVNIQRGEWIGYGKNHGIQGIDKKGHPGYLMETNGGTLFVDEFASLSRELQDNFLSVIGNASVQKVGGERFKPDVRCIFATNIDIDTAVATGVLRRDLVDRIGVWINIPPLRARRGDILLLARHFARGERFSDHCLVALLRYDWPGNVRELDLMIKRAVARKKMEEAASIDLEHLDLSDDIIAATQALDGKACRHELWSIAFEAGRSEGYEFGTGLQKRAAEIMGVRESQASKMYRELFSLPAATA